MPPKLVRVGKARPPLIAGALRYKARGAACEVQMLQSYSPLEVTNESNTHLRIW